MKKAVRLDKFRADAGAGTRSEVKKFIQKGKVQVNGVPAKKSEIKDTAISLWNRSVDGWWKCMICFLLGLLILTLWTREKRYSDR